MSQRKSTPKNRRNKKFWPILAAVTIGAFSASGNERNMPDGDARPCAVVEKSAGTAELLDATRTHTQVIEPDAVVNCGGWVSVTGTGWVMLRHRFGFLVHVGSDSFAQLQDDPDAVVLYRGQVYGQAGGGMGELSILTPNARTKVSRGSLVALFDPEEERTQVTVVDGNASFENRFQGGKKSNTVVKSGQVSNLDFKRLRILPSVPKTVATSSLKVKLRELHVPQKQRERALAIARNRQKQVFASFEEAQKLASEPARKPAHAEGEHKPVHGNMRPEKAQQDYLLRKQLGGNPEGFKILNPSASRKRAPAQVEVRVEDPETLLERERKGSEDTEKQRLMEELSKIHSD